MGLANYTICNQYDEVEPNLVRPLTANQVIRLTPGCAGSSPALAATCGCQDRRVWQLHKKQNSLCTVP